MTVTRPFAAASLGGVVAGSVDILAASAIFRTNPLTVMRSIAGGLLGPAAFGGGLPVAALGLMLQWAMSVLIAGIFVLAAGRFPALARRWAVAGIAYGVVVFVVMNYLVVPLSAIGHGLPHFGPFLFAANLVAMLVFGTIVAFFARRSCGVGHA